MTFSIETPSSPPTTLNATDLGVALRHASDPSVPIIDAFFFHEELAAPPDARRQ
jgi:hypothetical protein